MTPVASEGTKPSNSMGTARRRRTGQVFLTNQIVDLAGHDPVEALLPTPRTSDTNGAGSHGTGGPDLRTTVTLLPTPAVNDMGAGKTVQDWDAWTQRSGGHLTRSGARSNELLLPGVAKAIAAGSIGDSTPPPSTDGPQPWDVPLPLPLSPEPKDSHDSAPDSSSGCKDCPTGG
jgi:hypothetical protein